MKRRYFFMLIVLLINAGCLGPAKTQYVAEPTREILPPPINPIPVGKIGNVRLGEAVKAYPVGRYIDPSDPNLMHERHVVYRIEDHANWRLEASSDKQILLGNMVSNTNLNYQPAMLEEELAIELQKQRMINEQLSNSSEALIDGSLNMHAATLEIEKKVERLEKELQVREARIQSLKTQLNAQAILSNGKNKKSEPEI